MKIFVVLLKFAITKNFDYTVTDQLSTYKCDCEVAPINVSYCEFLSHGKYDSLKDWKLCTSKYQFL